MQMHQSGFNLCGAEAVTRNVEDVVHAPRDPQVAILIPAATISCKILPRIRLKVGREITLMVTPDGTSNPRPRLAHAEHACRGGWGEMGKGDNEREGKGKGWTRGEWIYVV